ncbi:hypothetical protein HMPREF9446_03605 [Bacteroides fluxus YIT 12057]|uniref:Uncharacterized protein n=1 Tax=Bacteroides fluxus YIT 12057 TaxID=763034 RepID=F3PXV7_9BACE|nr:hypothetical protein HMPREF9446_03605 [Bacteroides fluxus YIT 12057]
MGINFADTGFIGFGSDEHDDPYVTFPGNGLVTFFVILEGEVGDDDTVDAAFGTLPAEILETELHDGVEVAHEDERDVDVTANVLQLFEKEAEGHAVPEGAGGGVLDDDAVSHRVAERDADFYHVDSVLFKGTDNIGCTFQVRTAGTEVYGQQILGAVLEKWVDAVYHCCLRFYDFTIL